MARESGSHESDGDTTTVSPEEALGSITGDAAGPAESTRRAKSWLQRWFVTAVATVWMLFHLYTSWRGELPLSQHLAVVLGFALSLVFVWNPLKVNAHGRRPWWALLVDSVLTVLGVASCSYLVWNAESLALNPGLYNDVQLGVAVVLTVACIEGARRVVGLALPAFALVALAYAFYDGNLGIFTHSPFHGEYIFSSIVYTRQGIFASPMATIGTFLALFMILAALLEVTGIGRFFVDLARSAFGHRQGGAPKVALVSSALHGSISGAGVATTATTGSFTIPMMIRMGISPQRSAAFEATAGIGGALLPPIMGAAAFIMASFVGVPYMKVVIAALIPALLYYWTLYWVMDIESRKLKLRRESRSELPRTLQVLRRRGHQILPVAVLVWALLEGYSPGRAGLLAVVTAFVVSWFAADTRLTLDRFLRVMTSAARMMVTLVMAVTAIGAVISVLSITGLGLRLSGILLDLAGGSLLALLLLTALASVVLGAGLPATPVYLVLAILVTPALVDFGVPALAAHLFIFYFGVMGDMTPPLAVSPMVAAGIAGADPFKTTLTVVRIGLAGWVLPFWFVYSPGLTMDGGWWSIVRATVTAAAGLFLVAAALQRYLFRTMTRLEVVVAVAGAAALIIPLIWVNIAGIALLVLVVVRQRATSAGAAGPVADVVRSGIRG